MDTHANLNDGRYLVHSFKYRHYVVHVALIFKKHLDCSLCIGVRYGFGWIVNDGCLSP